MLVFLRDICSVGSLGAMNMVVLSLFALSCGEIALAEYDNKVTFLDVYEN